MSSESINKQHYESHTSSSYDSAYFYSPSGDYTSFLSDKVQQTLGIPNKAHDEDQWLLDIGGGTGTFTKMILENDDKLNGVVLDPYFEDTNADDTKLHFIKGTAEEITTETTSWWNTKNKYNYCLLKEVIHHLPTNNRINIFRGILSVLKPTQQFPSLLIITRPKYNIDYPLWNKARQVWSENQPSLEGIEDDLQSSGFSNVTHETVVYPCSMNLDVWLGMVRNRVWSTFSHFSNEDLEKGCDCIRGSVEVDENGDVHFEDRLIFITAKK